MYTCTYTNFLKIKAQNVKTLLQPRSVFLHNLGSLAILPELLHFLCFSVLFVNLFGFKVQTNVFFHIFD